jgi:GT2 family glycosyltransferase
VSPLATIVVVPRETFSRSIACLETIDARTPEPFELVWVDGDPPPPLRRRLEELSSARGFTLLRSSHPLSPNEARNQALAHVHTKYTVFLGNDVLVTDGWLDALVTCAEETGAAFVGGVSCWGAPDRPVVYCAGGETHIDERDGRRTLRDVHHHAGRPLRDVWPELRRQPSEAAVFHCVLVRTDVLDQLGGLDGRLHAFEHVDLCLRAQHRASGGWFEPRSLVVHAPPTRLRGADLRYFLLRWSRTWVDSSAAHFCRTWNLDPDDSGLDGNIRWLGDHRWSMLGRWRTSVRRVAGERALERVDALLDAVVTHTVVRAAARDRSR